jgi:Amt family ammonium transporter
MEIGCVKRSGAIAAGALMPLCLGGPALAAAPEAGNTGFVMIATVLVLLMAVPGLALFYGGLVRTKNVVSILMQVFATVCVVCILWLLYGYSLAFTNGGEYNDWIGGLSKAFLSGVSQTSETATRTNGVRLPEYVFIAFHMTFAAFAPALIVGALAERVRFAALLVVSALWVTFVYAPVAHMVWYWTGPDAIADAARAVLSAAPEAKTQAQAGLDAVLRDAGLIHRWGAIDFAGGAVVHVSAGIAGLVGALIIGRRSDYGQVPMPPHSLVMSLVGASLLWAGWFGFNCGSGLEANSTAALAMINTFGATVAAALAWVLAEWVIYGRPSLLGIMTGAVAGLVAITPACGFAGPMGAMALGAVTSLICFFFCTAIKNALRYDDSLDVFGVHCVAGVIGVLGAGVLVNPNLGGTGLFEYVSKPGEAVGAAYDMIAQITAQGKAVGVTLLWSGLVSAIIFQLVDVLIGLRPPEDDEREGLDISEHGERAYNF